MNQKPTKTPRQKTKWLAPKLLRPHPEIDRIDGRWDVESESFRALTDSIATHGVLEPIIITPDHQIMDGVTRWRAALSANVAQVPTLCRPEASWREILCTSELRRHSSKSNLAFRLYPVIAADYEGSGMARNLALKHQQNIVPAQNAVTMGKRVENWMSTLGISQRLLEQTRELYTLFETYEQPWNWTAADTEEKLVAAGLKPGVLYTFRQWASAMIIHEVMCTGYVLTALKQKIDQAARAAEGKEVSGGVQDGKQLQLFSETWRTAEKRWGYWADLDQAGKAKAVDHAVKAFEKAPLDFLEVTVKRLTAELRRRNQEGTL